MHLDNGTNPPRKFLSAGNPVSWHAATANSSTNTVALICENNIARPVLQTRRRAKTYRERTIRVRPVL